MIKKFLPTVLSLGMICILLGYAALSTSQSSNNEQQANASDTSFTLFDMIPHDTSRIRLNAYGNTITLNDAEVDSFLEITREVEYYMTNGEEDISAPGAIVITITVENDSEESQKLTLPYFLHEETLYSAGAQSVSLFNDFFNASP